MNVSLTPRLEEIVRKKVESGLYNNASEVVREAIRQMDAHDRQLERLRAAIAVGYQSLKSEPTYRWGDHSVAEIMELAAQANRDGEEITHDVRP